MRIPRRSFECFRRLRIKFCPVTFANYRENTDAVDVLLRISLIEFLRDAGADRALERVVTTIGCPPQSLLESPTETLTSAPAQLRTGNGLLPVVKFERVNILFSYSNDRTMRDLK